MARQITLSRDEAEYLVDLLEALPTGAGEHYMAHEIAETLRDLFGMVERSQE